jgi:hypothetical protein
LAITTIILPISREQHLLKVFTSLEMLECDRDRTSLLAFVDGEADLFSTARNLVEQSKFAVRLCVQGNIPGERREFSINTRRRRIAAIQNACRELVEPCDHVFLIEDDGVLPAGALSRLRQDHLSYPHAGFVTGVQYGRWGINHLGLWAVDDPYEPMKIESLMPSSGVAEVDAAGLYATLMRYDLYKKHEFKPFGEALGPDFNMGIELRQEGYRNYVDFDVWVDHLKPDGTALTRTNTEAVQMRFVKEGEAWSGDIIEDESA